MKQIESFANIMYYSALTALVASVVYVTGDIPGSVYAAFMCVCVGCVGVGGYRAMCRALQSGGRGKDETPPSNS